MKREKQIAELIRKIANDGAYEIHQGFVKSIHANGTINVEIDDDVIVSGVRVNVVEDMSYGVILTPEVNSPCIICQIENGQEYQLLQCAKLDKLRIRVGSQILDMDKDKISMNEGKLGGMLKLNETLQKLNQLEEKYNTLLTALQGIVIPMSPTGTVPLAPYLSGATMVTPTVKTEIENPKVKQ